MKLIIIIVLLSLFSNNVFSQSGWIQQTSGITSKINAVYFENSQTGWSVGDSGKIIKTTNGGTNWYLINSGTFKNLNSLSFNSLNNAFIVGDSGIVLNTTNGGNNWNYSNFPNHNYFFNAVVFVNDSIGYIGGTPDDFFSISKVFKTSNGGDSWDSLSSEASFVKAIYFINPVIGWIIQGYNAVGVQHISKTIDGGLNWTIQFSNSSLNTVFFYNILNGWTSGYGSGFNVYKSTNGGSNWIPCLFCGLNPVHSFFFTDSLKGWGASEDGIIHTTNAGTNWIVQNSSHPLVTYNSIHFTDSLTGWVVGDSGIILKTTTGGVLTNFTNTSSEIPDKYYLSQNYPNPFNPVTVISYTIPSNVKREMSNVRILIYDNLGKEITSLVNENKPAGRYEVTFNGAGLSERDILLQTYFRELFIYKEDDVNQIIYHKLIRMKNIFFCIFIFSSTVIFSQGEPWKHPLKMCRSADGTNFTGIQTFQDSSGVPNFIKLPSGNLACVFQWFRQPVGSPSWDRVAVKFSSNNGINWTEPTPIVVNGLPGNFTRPFDPTLAITDNNRIRIFFSSGLNMILDTSINTYSAISDDGINYTFENGIRFTMPDRPVLDPAVIKFRNLWHLANPISNMTISGAFHNISNDGLNFTRVQDINSDATHSWIGNYMINDTNELRFYGSGMNVWFSSSPNGGEWSTFYSTNIQGGDPSVLRLSSNDYLMIYTGPPYTVNIPAASNSIPEMFALYQNFPNPFNPLTKINYELRVTNYVSLVVYDILGNEVRTLVNENKPAGRYEVTFNGAGLPSGIYFYRLEVSPSNPMESVVFMDIKRMVMIK